MLSAAIRIRRQHNGGEYPNVRHEGKTYYAIEPEDPFEIRVVIDGNPLRKRAEVVCSVDGRDVIVNEPADYTKHRGLVTDTSYVEFKGWRTSSSEVKGFVAKALGRGASTSEKNNGAVASRGTIAAAIFAERVTTSTPRRYLLGGDGLESTRGGSDGSRGLECFGPRPNLESRGSGGNLFDSFGPSLESRGSGIAPVSFSADHEISRGGGFRSFVPSSHVPAPSVGTGAGATIIDRVGTTTFTRYGDPILLEVEYDSKANLIARGIWPQEQQPAPASKGWPGMPAPVPGFCDPNKL